LSQQVLLLRVQIGNERAQLVHLFLSAQEATWSRCFGGRTVTAQIDRRIEECKPLRNEASNRRQSRLLPRLTMRKHPQRIQGTVDVGMSAAIWLEKGFDPGQQISPLSSFRIHGARKKSVRPFDDRVAPSHLFNIRNNATRLIVGERANQQNQHCRDQRQ
jgi:hypothetical protein